MKTNIDCIPCFLRQSLDAARIFTDDPGVHEQIIRDILRLCADLDFDLPPPWVGQIIHRRLRDLTGVRDPYRDAKRKFNTMVLDLLPELRGYVESSPQPLVAAANLAIAGNVIDLGATSSVTEKQILTALCESARESSHDGWDAFAQRVTEATDILYLADNAGEIVVDRLLIEQLGPERVTLALRGHPVINDATLEDARQAGLHEIVDIIDNGSDAPGTILEDCSLAFRETLSNADLIIAKGQGNFESLSEIDADIFFLFKAKCPVVAAHAGLPMGTHALLRGARTQDA